MRTKAAFLVFALWAQGAVAQESQPTAGAQRVGQLVQCRSVADRDARLACYDREVAGLAAAIDSREIVVVDREVVRETRRSLFGFATPARGLLAETPEDEITQLTTSLTAVRPFGVGRYRLGLKDAGTWETLEAQSTLFPKTGDTVELKRGLLGSYIATVGRSRAVRVKRVD